MTPERPAARSPLGQPTRGANPVPGSIGTADTSPSDVRREAAGRFLTAPSATPAPAAPEPAPEVDYPDAEAVAKGYVAARLTYRFEDPAGYAAALASPAFTTSAFAARSTPGASALARLASSQETSAVTVGGVGLAVEVPNTASTRYVVVSCTVTTTYRGGGDTAPAAWTLRLLQVAPGRWRVDGVLSTN